MMEEMKQKKNPMEKIATFIVDKRNLFCGACFQYFCALLGEG